MNSLWNAADATQFRGDLEQLVYASRLLGGDPVLVLHGGGNTSVKLVEPNLFGEQEEVLYVKGRGADLATIDAHGFAPCRLKALLRLTELSELSDEQMESELRSSMTRPFGVAPSVETLLHAIIPAKFVNHTHSDALISVMNSTDGLERVREMFGDRVVIVPYAMPGFKLVRSARGIFAKQATSKTVGMVLLHHGLFTFGDTAKSAYERMIQLVDETEKYLAARNAWKLDAPTPEAAGRKHRVAAGDCGSKQRLEIAALRREVSIAAGAPIVVATHSDPQSMSFARRSDVAELAERGGVTPDHVIRTKRIPLIGRDVAGYRAAYEQYVRSHAAGRKVASVDPAPRVILDPELGMCTVGRTAEDAAICENIYRHTIDIILRAERLGGWRALPAQDFFDVEYWDMERAKLGRSDNERPFAGEVALVTGAASGIGKACVDSLLARGAAVVGMDISPAIHDIYDRPDYFSIECDLTNEQHIAAALEQSVRAFGGVDMLVLNAGIFPKSAPVAGLSTETWNRVMSINLDSNLVLMRECHPLLKLSYRGGRVVIIGSKNVPAPGPGAAAYSASKAALQQLSRVAALEWGEDRIRINTLHPNGVFDTGIWTPEVLAARAASYKMSVEEYKTNNVLKTEVTSRDVAEMAAELCGRIFARTTGAQIPVDGGNTRII